MDGFVLNHLELPHPPSRHSTELPAFASAGAAVAGAAVAEAGVAEAGVAEACVLVGALRGSSDHESRESLSTIYRCLQVLLCLAPHGDTPCSGPGKATCGRSAWDEAGRLSSYHRYAAHCGWHIYIEC